MEFIIYLAILTWNPINAGFNHLCCMCMKYHPKPFIPSSASFLILHIKLKKKKKNGSYRLWFCFLSSSSSSLISNINFFVIIKMILLGIINEQRIIPLYISPHLMCIFLCRDKCSSFSTLYNKLLYICKTLSLILVKWSLRWASKIEEILKLHLLARIRV